MIEANQSTPAQESDGSQLPTTPGRRKDWGASAVFWILVLALGLILSGGYYMNARLAQLEVEASHGNILVVDVGRMASMYPVGVQGAELDEMVKAVNQILLDLSDAGYIILDRQEVLAAPESVRLSAEVLFERAGVTATPFDGVGLRPEIPQ